MIKLYHGKESFLSLLEAKKYIESINTDNSFEYVSVEAGNIDPEKLIQYISTDNIFNTPRIYLFKRLFTNKNKEGIVEFLIKQLTTSNTSHYIFWEEQKIPSNTKYLKFFKKDSQEISVMNKPAFYAFAKSLLEENNIQCDRNTAIELSSRVNFSAERLVNEIEKFKIEGIEKLTTQLVEQKTTDTLERAIWDLTKYINLGQQSEVFKTYTNLNTQQVDPHFIISMLARNIRLIAQVKHMNELGENSGSICSKLRIPPFTLPELLNSAKSTNWEKVKFTYEKLASLDYEIKRGNIEPNTGLVLLISRL